MLLLRRADSRTRTGDPRITNALLYQLSHIGRSPLAGAKVTFLFGTCKFYASFFRLKRIFCIFYLLPLVLITVCSVVCGFVVTNANEGAAGYKPHIDL